MSKPKRRADIEAAAIMNDLDRLLVSIRFSKKDTLKKLEEELRHAIVHAYIDETVDPVIPKCTADEADVANAFREYIGYCGPMKIDLFSEVSKKYKREEGRGYRRARKLQPTSTTLD